MASFVNTPKKISASQSEKVANVIANMIVKDYIPLSIVESEGFINLMQMVALECKVQSRNTEKSCIKKKYEYERNFLVRNLNSVQCRLPQIHYHGSLLLQTVT